VQEKYFADQQDNGVIVEVDEKTEARAAMRKRLEAELNEEVEEEIAW
jgi:hypothetical protein